MKNKYLLYLGLMGTCTPLSMLLWVWWVVDVEALSNLLSNSTKFYTLLGGILISIIFAGITVYFMIQSRVRCSNCGAEMERQIIQAEKLATVGQLAGGVAHEVNTPASIISGRVETMFLESSRFSDQDKKDLDVIKNQADRITQITRSLLLFSKRNPVDKTRINLNEVVNEAVSLIEQQFSKLKIVIVKTLFPQALIIFGQHNQLVQVLLNLLTNARDAMPHGGKIEIHTALSSNVKQKALITLKDTGAGIHPHSLDKIFDPFYTTKQSGTGLGLSVSYGIVEDHGGTIQVKSKLGDGAIFFIHLPLVK
ncbi:MAG: hypothetical protein HYT97_06125 [Elusimicrobia bacterium]|nr:hypothetical protein [Elusimicrobiota bacterium]